MENRIGLPHDRLHALWPSNLRGSKLGAVLHPASVRSDLVHLTTDLLATGAPFRLACLMGPQHGIFGHTQDNMVEWEGEAKGPFGSLPVYSLYGRVRKPTPGMLDGLDALLVDLQDIGTRHYTFVWTLKLCMEAAAEANIAVVVPDRPNPIGGRVEGMGLDPGFFSFVGLHPVPVRHGLTIGEMARLMAAEMPRAPELHVLPMNGWVRQMEWEDTGLPWVLPSPNMPTPDTARVYPGTCLLEGTTASEGRGTTRPFEIVGAPWIDARRFREDLDSLRLPGVFHRELNFQPTFHKGVGRLCGGVQIHVTDRRSFRPVLEGWAVLWALRRQGFVNHSVPIDPFDPRQLPDAFGWKAPPYEYEETLLPIDILAGHDRWRKLIESGAGPWDLADLWEPEENAWNERIAPHILYPAASK